MGGSLNHSIYLVWKAPQRPLHITVFAPVVYLKQSKEVVGLTQTQVQFSEVKALSQVKGNPPTASQELAAVGARPETCAFKELGGGGAGQEADSPETPPPARSFLGKGRGGPSYGPRPLSDRLVVVPRSAVGEGDRGRRSRLGLGSSSLGVPPTKAQVC